MVLGLSAPLRLSGERVELISSSVATPLKLLAMEGDGAPDDITFAAKAIFNSSPLDVASLIPFDNPFTILGLL